MCSKSQVTTGKSLFRPRESSIFGWLESRKVRRGEYNVKHCLIDFAQVALWTGQEAENEFAAHGDPLEHRFLELADVTFCVVQKIKNVFTRAGDPLKRRFLEISHVAF
jgi:hypothetical protein